MSGFVKIYGSILRSSVWQLTLPTKITWITMLALADENGVVEASVPGLAVTAGVTLEECEAALERFLAPDKYSSSTEDEGRRIRPCRGGWLVINHSHYREMRTTKQVADAARLASKRASQPAAAPCDMSATKATCRNVALDTDQIRSDQELATHAIVEPIEPTRIVPVVGPGMADADLACPKVVKPDAVKPDRKVTRTKRVSAVETLLPDDWAPNAASRAFATKHGIDLERAVFAFRQWYEGKRCASWNGRFATWLTRHRVTDQPAASAVVESKDRSAASVLAEIRKGRS